MGGYFSQVTGGKFCPWCNFSQEGGRKKSLAMGSPREYCQAHSLFFVPLSMLKCHIFTFQLNWMLISPFFYVSIFYCFPYFFNIFLQIFLEHYDHLFVSLSVCPSVSCIFTDRYYFTIHYVASMCCHMSYGHLIFVKFDTLKKYEFSKVIWSFENFKEIWSFLKNFEFLRILSVLVEIFCVIFTLEVIVLFCQKLFVSSSLF